MSPSQHRSSLIWLTCPGRRGETKMHNSSTRSCTFCFTCCCPPFLELQLFTSTTFIIHTLTSTVAPYDMTEQLIAMLSCYSVDCTCMLRKSVIVLVLVFSCSLVVYLFVLVAYVDTLLKIMCFVLICVLKV